ncbi:NAD(P)-binding domain-containing protein [Sphingobium sp. AN558]|uniref:NADPH-dependent F420 reductase n=1 Tax=Sphingobium sp. AN558 TaxID=3133442 RepID=UPI0030BB134C
MKIGIVGIGSIGGTLARKLSAAGHSVAIANSKDAKSVQAFADEIGATAADAKDAVAGADLIILSIPLPAVSDLPEDLFDAVPQNVPVIDTGNYYPGMRDPQIAEIDAGEVESLWVSRQIGRPVIKAFNNILAYSLAELGQARGTPGRLAIAVAGDEPAHKALVSDIVDSIGFEPVDAGTLAESWRQQPATPAYCCDYDADTMRKALTQARIGEAPKTRDHLLTQYGSLDHSPTHEDFIKLNRSANPLASM